MGRAALAYSPFTAYRMLPWSPLSAGYRLHSAWYTSPAVKPSPTSTSASRVPASSLSRANKRTFAFMAHSVYTRLRCSFFLLPC